MSKKPPSLLRIGGVPVKPGERVAIDLPVARLHTGTQLTMPMRVIRGKHEGPTLFVSAAIHGDEINGVEIIRRLLRLKSLDRLSGTLIAVPIVNVFGFIGHSRYLPDRRDLNRSFPGSEGGSLAARLSALFLSEVVEQSTHGIDLHTGSKRRTNLPHVRVRFENREAKRLAVAFGTPVVLNASLRSGSLREAVSEKRIPVIVYEGGEDLRFDEWAIRAGVRGVQSVMTTLGMLPKTHGGKKRPRHKPFMAKSSTWVRSPEGGIFRALVRLGARVKRRQPLAVIADPLGENEVLVEAPVAGVVIGENRLPLVNQGDQLFHVAKVAKGRSDEHDPLADFLAEHFGL